MHLHRTHRVGRTPARSLTPLLVQAGLARSLASVLTVLAIALLTLGTYILFELLHHPLEAQATETIGAAVMITLAAMIVVHLLQPAGAERSRHDRHKPDGTVRLPRPMSNAQVIEIPGINPQTARPFARRAADRQAPGD